MAISPATCQRLYLKKTADHSYNQPVLALALLLFSLAVSGCSSREELLLQEAENLWYSNEYTESIRLFIQIVDRYPESEYAEVALLRIGETYLLNLSDSEKSLEYFNRLLIDFPRGKSVKSAREYMAMAYEERLNEYDKAVIQYQHLLDMNGKDADKYQLAIGRSYYKKGDYRQAIIEYKVLLKRFAQSKLAADAEFGIGNCYFVMNNCKKALKQYLVTLENHPSSKYRYDINLSRGVCLEEQEGYGEALDLYRQILDKYPNRELIQRKIDAVLLRMRNKNR